MRPVAQALTGTPNTHFWLGVRVPPFSSCCGILFAGLTDIQIVHHLFIQRFLEFTRRRKLGRVERAASSCSTRRGAHEDQPLVNVERLSTGAPSSIAPYNSIGGLQGPSILVCNIPRIFRLNVG